MYVLADKYFYCHTSPSPLHAEEFPEELKTEEHAKIHRI